MRMRSPCAPSCFAVTHIPSATPACGSSVIPRYRQMFSLQCVIFALVKVPKYLPRERMAMYTSPMQTIIRSENTPRSNSAPLMTKNTANSGDVHLSALPIRSDDSGQILQNTVPSIMQTSSDEKPIVTGPTGNSSLASATVRNTNAMVIFRRLVLELKSFSSCVSSHPITAPSASDSTISSSGLTRIAIRSTDPKQMALAIPNETANTTRPTASSSATIGSRRSTTGPFALYWRTTISVAAGAVAVAIAPSVIACATLMRPFVSTQASSSAKSTSSVAASA